MKKNPSNTLGLSSQHNFEKGSRHHVKLYGREKH